MTERYRWPGLFEVQRGMISVLNPTIGSFLKVGELEIDRKCRNRLWYAPFVWQVRSLGTGIVFKECA